MAYTYNDYILAQNIIESIRKKYEPKNRITVNTTVEEELDFIKNNLIARSCNNVNLLISLERNLLKNNPLIDFTKIRDIINNELPIYIESVLLENRIRYNIYADMCYDFYIEQEGEELILRKVIPFSVILYRISIKDFNKNPNIFYNDVIYKLIDLYATYQGKASFTDNKIEKLNLLNECWAFIKNQTNIYEKIDTIIDFKNNLLVFSYKNIKLFIDPMLEAYENETGYIYINDEYKKDELYKIGYSDYEKDKEQFYKDLYTIISVHFGAALEEGKLNDI